LDQACTHGILADVLALLFQAFIGPQHVIERLFLPHWAGSVKKFVNAMGRSALQALHNFKPLGKANRSYFATV